MLLIIKLFLPMIISLGTNYSDLEICVNVSGGDLSRIPAPCWHNWTHGSKVFESDNASPMIWSHTFRDWEDGGKVVNVDLENVSTLAEQNPGRIWLLWNEPDLIGQANTPPLEASGHTKLWVDAIGRKGAIACCGTLHLGPQCNIPGTGIEWLNQYTGPIPDLWHFHIYCVTSIEEFDLVLDQWWQWWEINGHGKPVIISETSGGTNTILNTNLLNHIFDIDDERILQIYWFATYNSGDTTWSSQLLDLDNGLTRLGEIYIRKTQPWRGYGLQ